MSIIEAKCANCGAKLEYDKNNNLFCPSCGSSYLDKDDINNVYVNNNITKNYYGNEVAQDDIKSDRINGLLLQITKSISRGNYSEARHYCISIIEKEPYNMCATIFKEIIEDITRQSNGRYLKSFDIDVFFEMLEYISKDKNLPQYYNIFPYYEILLDSLEVTPSLEILENFEKNIEIFSKIDNDYAKNFCVVLKNRKSEIKTKYEKTIADKKERNDKLLAEKQEEDQAIAELSKANDIRNGLIFGLVITVCITLMLFVIVIS